VPLVISGKGTGSGEIQGAMNFNRNYYGMNKGIPFRGWGIACAGQQVYAPRYRAEWLAKITEAGVRRRAEICYKQFDQKPKTSSTAT
jgi:hypothetical protein